MRFYNREREIALLNELNEMRPSFLVILGRRRVGKTELIRRFLEGRRSLYLYVDDRKGADLLLSEYSAYIKTQLGLPEYISFDTFHSLFKFLLTEAGDTIVAIDEFQRLASIDPSIVTGLQDLWDREGKRKGPFLIASGSSMGMMHQIFLDRGAPLFKRADNVVTLKPFGMANVFEVLEGIGVTNEASKVDLHCLFGGMVLYYNLMERYKVKSLGAAIDRLILDDLAPLRNEVRDILVEGFGRKHSTYFEILAAIAEGRSTKSDIGDVVHVKASSLSPYLNDLRDVLHLVEHAVPILDDPRRSKRGRYLLKDNFFRFYFRFIFPNSSLYEVGAYDRLREVIDAGWGAHKGTAFEGEVRSCLSSLLVMEYPKVAPYWDRKGNEIDLVGLRLKDRRMLAIEIKAKKLSSKKARSVIHDLEAKLPTIPYEAREVTLGLAALSVGGRRDLEAEGHRIWELKDILEASMRRPLSS